MTAARGKKPTITLLTAVAAGLMLVASACSSASDTSEITTAATVPPTTVSLEDWVSAAAAVCDEFHSSSVAGQWSGSARYAKAAEDLSRLTHSSDEAAAALVLAMEEAAAAVETFSIEIEKSVAPDESWSLDEAGRVWATPAGAAWFQSRQSDVPEDVGLVMLTALDELGRSAVGLDLNDCMP